MKIRTIDSKLVPAIRRPVDKTWEAFANHLYAAFGDITQQNGASKEDVGMIYCHQRLREIDGKLLDSLVYNVPPAFTSPDDLIAPPVLDDTGVGYFDSRLQWRASKDSPFLLLGYVGTGKTTFLDFYFYHHLASEKPDECAAIVDYKKGQDKDQDFVMHMIEKVEACVADIQPQHARKNRAALEVLYSDEVLAIRNSIADRRTQDSEIDRLFAFVLRSKVEKDIGTYASFVGRQIQCLKATGKRLWIILDNIDQHFHCLHHQAFVNTVAIANKWECPLIISMRYVTLQTPGARQTHDSFRPRSLRLSLPNIEQMLGKRLAYFKLLADNLLDRPLDWTARLLNIRDLSVELQKSIALLCRPPFLSAVLLPLSNYNLRRLLDILLSCFQSYYFFFDRFNSERYPPNDRILFKRFLFSHLLKNNEFYDPSSRNDQDAFILNLFENENPASPTNQFIRVRLLQVLLYFGRSVSLQRLDNYLQAVFRFDRHDVLQAMRSFLDRDLIALKNVLSVNFDTSLTHTGLQETHLARPDIEVAVTWSGRLHYDLLSRLEYLEIMKFSTYVDAPIYPDIQAQSQSSTFDARARSTRKFVDYLTRQEEAEIVVSVQDRTRFNEQIKKVMPEISCSINQQLDQIANLPEHRASKAPG